MIACLSCKKCEGCVCVSNDISSVLQGQRMSRIGDVIIFTKSDQIFQVYQFLIEVPLISVCGRPEYQTNFGTPGTKTRIFDVCFTHKKQTGQL